jgi:hypothetical protein
MTSGSAQGTGGRLHAPGFLLGIICQPELSGCARRGEYPGHVANEACIIVGVAGPLLRGDIGKQLADPRLALSEDHQSRVQAGEETTEPVARRRAVADRASKAARSIS